MKNNVIALIAGLGLSSGAIACPEFLDTEMRKLGSKETINFCESYAGKPMLIVNTASNCGYTPQFSGLESLHQEYKDKGLLSLAFRRTISSKKKMTRLMRQPYVSAGTRFHFRLWQRHQCVVGVQTLSSRDWEKHRVTHAGTSTNTWSQETVKWLLNLGRV